MGLYDQLKTLGSSGKLIKYGKMSETGPQRSFRGSILLAEALAEAHFSILRESRSKAYGNGRLGSSEETQP